MRLLDYVYILALLLIATGLFFLSKGKQPKSAFVYNQEVFKSFKGTAELEARLRTVKEKDERKADSLFSMLGKGQITQLQYQSHLQDLNAHYSQVTTDYTADVWKFINDGVNEFGKEQQYDYIFGAAGNGSLMYAADAKNITSDVISFLNNKYSGK